MANDEPDATEVAALADELRGVLGRRLPETFKDPASHDVDEMFPITARVVQTLEQHIWDRDPPGALIAVMRQGAANLPDVVFPDATITWRYLAETLAGLRSETAPRADGSRHTYDSLHKEIYTKFFNASATTFKRRIRDMRLMLARILLELESGAIESQENSPPSLVDPTLIDRSTYTDYIRSYVDAGHLIVCIWGEPGTGKTVLAEQAAILIAQSRPILKLRPADANVLRDDIVDVLITEGLEPTNWGDSYCRAALRHALSGQPKSGVLILDNIEDEELVWQLIPKLPPIPVLITMRNEPQNPEIKKVELFSFTEKQACAFITGYLNNSDEAGTLALARVLGCRPLALDHAVRFIHQSSDVTIHDLVTKLRTNITEGLNLVTSPADHARNLINLYKAILAFVVYDQTALRLLDNFLAVAGKGGMEDRELLYLFMQSEFGGSSDRVRLAAGRRTLAMLGLLREESSHGHRTKPLLVMHPLTYDILRDLRIPVPFEIEYKYLEFILSRRAESVIPGQVTSGTSLAYMKHRIMDIVSELNLPTGWKTIHAVDESTWMAVREQPEGVDSDTGEITTSDYIVRYELHSDNSVYMLDYRTGERRKPDDFEAQQLAQAIQLYHGAVKPFLREIQDMNLDSDDRTGTEEELPEEE